MEQKTRVATSDPKSPLSGVGGVNMIREKCPHHGLESRFPLQDKQLWKCNGLFFILKSSLISKVKKLCDFFMYKFVFQSKIIANFVVVGYKSYKF